MAKKTYTVLEPEGLFVARSFLGLEAVADDAEQVEFEFSSGDQEKAVLAAGWLEESDAKPKKGKS